MHPTLFHIPNHIPGLETPVFGTGLLLALWAVASAVFLGWLVWRQGFDSDTGSYAILLAVLGLVIYWLLPKMCEPDGLPIRSYGLMLLLGVVAGMMLAVRRARRVGIDPDLIFSLVFWMLIPGILCARVFYVIEYWPSYYQPGVSSSKVIGDVLNIASGGLVVYGSLLGAVAGLMIFARRHRMPILALADLMVPSLLLGLGFGRIGCLMYGCCFGGLCDHAWAITFPWNSPPHVRQV